MLFVSIGCLLLAALQGAHANNCGAPAGTDQAQVDAHVQCHLDSAQSAERNTPESADRNAPQSVTSFERKGPKGSKGSKSPMCLAGINVCMTVASDAEYDVNCCGSSCGHCPVKCAPAQSKGEFVRVKTATGERTTEPYDGDAVTYVCAEEGGGKHSNGKHKKGKHKNDKNDKVTFVQPLMQISLPGVCYENNCIGEGACLLIREDMLARGDAGGNPDDFECVHSFTRYECDCSLQSPSGNVIHSGGHWCQGDEKGQNRGHGPDSGRYVLSEAKRGKTVTISSPPFAHFAAAAALAAGVALAITRRRATAAADGPDAATAAGPIVHLTPGDHSPTEADNAILV